MRTIEIDALSYNDFKGCWSARVTLLDDGRVCVGCQIEAKTKYEAQAEALSEAYRLSGEYKTAFINKD